MLHHGAQLHRCFPAPPLPRGHGRGPVAPLRRQPPDDPTQGAGAARGRRTGLPIGLLLVAILAALALAPVVRGITAGLVQTVGAIVPAAADCAHPLLPGCEREGAVAAAPRRGPTR